jgi:hypothetical protein
MRVVGWLAMLMLREGFLPSAVLLLLLGSCGRSSVASRDGAVPDSAATATEVTPFEADGPLPISDANSDPVQAAAETGAADADASPSDVGMSPDTTTDSSDVGRNPDMAIDTRDVGPIPDALPDSREVDLTSSDLGADEDSGTGSDAFLPTGCVGQNLYVDVVDILQRDYPSTHLAYSKGSSIPLATGNASVVSIAVSQEPDGGGAKLYVDLCIEGPQLAYTCGVWWRPTGSSTTMDDSCSGGKPVTITRFDTSGGILEGDFQYLTVGYSCGTLDVSLNGHFRVCYIPTS